MGFPFLGAGGAAAFGAIAGLANLGTNLGLNRGQVSASDIINMTFDAGAVAGFLARGKVSGWLADDVYGDSRTNAQQNLMFRLAWILVWMLTVIEVVEQLNGFGSPVKGDQLTDGNSKFGAANQTLVSANPDTNQWSGGADSAYANLNSLQQTSTSDMATADQDMAQILERQAGQVEQVRIGLAATKLAVLAAIPYALRLAAIPGGGQEVSEAFQMRVALAALLTVLGLLGYLIGEGIINGNDLQDKVIDKYNAVADAAAKVDLTKKLSELGVPLAAPSVVPDVADPNSSGPPDVTGSAVEGVAAGQGAVIGDSAGNDTRAEPQTPASAPAMPTLAQLMAVSGHTTKLFEPGSQRTTPVKAGAPARRAAAEEAEAAGAAPGAEHAEAAPIEVAGAGAQEQREPTRSR